MKAEKLPSGNWRARAYLGTDENGKPITKSVTGPDKKTVLLEAARLQDEYRNGATRQSFGAAAGEWLAANDVVMSPSTIRAYTSMCKTLQDKYPALWTARLTAIDAGTVQTVVNGMIKDGRKPKTVGNYYGMISAILTYKGAPVPTVRMPQRERADLHIPDEETVRHIIEISRDTDLYVPILLAAFGPMRRGEICGVKREDVNGNVIHVQRDVVLDKDKVWREKPPKTYTSNRYLEMPEDVINALLNLEPDADGHLVALNPGQISDKFRRLVGSGPDACRFHDLRHFCVSYLHAMGVPDIYIQQRTGHASPEVLRQVYTHTLADQSEEQTRRIMDNFNSLLHS